MDHRTKSVTTIVPFIKIGLDRGELCLYISNEENDTVTIDALKAQGIDIEKAITNGSLILTNKKEIYFKLGKFDIDWTLRVIKNIADLAKSYGFTAMRVLSDMSWTQEKVEGVEKWPEYESRLNTLSTDIFIRIICQYERDLFSPEALLGALQTHPKVIIDGMICKNQFYIQTDKLLKGEYAEIELSNVLNSIHSSNDLDIVISDRDKRLKDLRDRLDDVTSAQKDL